MRSIRHQAITVGILCSLVVGMTGEAWAAFISNTVTITGVSITTASTPPPPPVPTQFAVRLFPTADTWFDEAQADENFGRDSTLEVESQASQNHRALYRFDLASLPAGSTIDDCSLNLFMNEEPRTDREHGVYRLSDHEADWGEGTQNGGAADPGASSWTWYANPGVWTAAGGDLAGLPTATSATGTVEEVWRSWDVGTDCDAPAARSWAVRDTTESIAGLDGTGAEYTSKEGSGTAKDPYLALDFTVLPPDAGHVTISEVYYDVASDKGSDTPNEWVELYNPTNSSVNLTGWELCDASDCDTLPSGTTIPAKSFLVVTPNASTFTFWSVPAAAQVVLGESLSLSNAGDQVSLKNASAATVDALSYGSNTGIMNPALVDVDKGWSLARLTPGFDTDAASNFWGNPAPVPGT
ncbi:lamin tail domain-containing protein [Candidatus Berkelbacteria bacterium]|nr:lamin tail domain-containing protein [Candidatus Berkelbacteria bacterium]